MPRASILGNGREWRLLSPHSAVVEEISAACGVSKVTAQVLANRGLTSAEQARSFLAADLDDLQDPFLIPDMDIASQRLAEAVRQGEKVVIYGDYDADGVTSTALLYMTLTQLGGRPTCYIPDRTTEGYGLNTGALAQIARTGARLVVALDCGVRSHREVEFARNQGMEVVIVDHHLPAATLPAATAVVCPKREDGGQPFRDLASAGLAFRLGQALLDTLGVRTSHFQRASLDLVALGTLADIVPLCGENRALVKRGLEALGETRKPGLIALMQAAGIGTVSEREVSFALVPRLNAAGRVRHADLALNLLLARDPEAAHCLARELESANGQRQKEQRKVQREATWHLGLDTKAQGPEPKVLVLWSEGWHEGVLGIVASRLLEETGWPTILLTVKGEEAKGSARSIPGFNMTEALERCSELLLRSGGHARAAGLSLPRENLPAFKELINTLAQEMIVEGDPSRLGRTSPLQIDAALPLAEANLRLLEELETLAPFGEGNPGPVFLTEEVFASDIRRVGADRSHLVFNLSQPQAASGQRPAGSVQQAHGPSTSRAGQAVRRCVAFQAGSLELQEGSLVSACFHLRPDDYGNGLHPQLEVVDVRECQ